MTRNGSIFHRRYKLYMHCPNCGFPIDRRNLPTVCPKCDEDLVRAKARKPLVVDLAHGARRFRRRWPSSTLR